MRCSKLAIPVVGQDVACLSALAVRTQPQSVQSAAVAAFAVAVAAAFASRQSAQQRGLSATTTENNILTSSHLSLTEAWQALVTAGSNCCCHCTEDGWWSTWVTTALSSTGVVTTIEYSLEPPGTEVAQLVVRVPCSSSHQRDADQCEEGAVDHLQKHQQGR